VPVVATDIPVVREVTGELAVLAPVGEPAALAAALRTALSGPADPAPLRERARQFSWAACAAETAKAYRAAAS
jgi:glycosyltransferase involved in cell wall biosynthesis